MMDMYDILEYVELVQHKTESIRYPWNQHHRKICINTFPHFTISKVQKETNLFILYTTTSIGI